MALSPVERINLTAELRKKTEEIGSANSLAKIGIARRIADIVAMLEGKQDAPEVVPQSSTEAKPSHCYRVGKRERLGMLQEKINSFKRKAAKLGVDPVSIEVGETRMMRVIYREKAMLFGTFMPAQFKTIPIREKVPGDYEDRGIVKQYLVTITGDLPQLSGWRFVATLDHMGKANLVKSAPGGGAVPERFLTAKSVCEHCGTTRNRNKTVVVANEEGKYVQVGSNCLKDFLGHGDAEALAALAHWRSNFWDEFVAEEGYSESDEGGSRISSYIEVERFLKYVAASVRERGWISNQVAEERMILSTRDDAMLAYMPPKGQKRPFEATEADIQKSKDALTWARGLTEADVAGNSFMHNIRAVAGEDAVKVSNAGIAAAVIVAYDKAMDKSRAVKKDTANSQWQGQIAKRQVFKSLTVDKVIATEGMYGTTLIHKMSDQDGNVFIWFASGNPLEEGATYDMKATVKKHDERDGVKQTVITRVAPEGGGPKVILAVKDKGDTVQGLSTLKEAGVSAEVHESLTQSLNWLKSAFPVGDLVSGGITYTSGLTSEYNHFDKALVFSTEGLSGTADEADEAVNKAIGAEGVAGGLGGLIAHEYAHAIDASIKQISDEVFDAWKSRKAEIKDQVGIPSAYAKKNDREWFAEQFTKEILNGDGPLIAAIKEFLRRR